MSFVIIFRMNRPYFTTILLFMVAVCQFIICVELQGAETIHGNDKDSDINVSAQGPTIFFEKNRTLILGKSFITVCREGYNDQDYQPIFSF